MSRTFQFIDHRDGVILNRNLALAGRIYQVATTEDGYAARLALNSGCVKAVR